MAWASTAPDAVNALVALTKTVVDPHTVLDGPTPGNSALQEAVTIGFEDEDVPAVVEADVNPEGLAGNPDREQYSITCKVEVARGSGDIASARARAYELLGIVGAAVKENRGLGGVVNRAWVGSHVLRQVQDHRGAVAEVRFAVEVATFTKR
ncbi:hypothetical protein [Prauserella endophytica]|uniref:DUF3168 domain-containing protein n=1 Tax=Prauserella endophytica TaxID=1592324 RepID=A0ABY2RST8_9PSEU|nr:hypothetical protein [Prauserella endophytica]TKG58894.1 hypothetical protein FCN18_37410 [Prauserella endophytica]